MIFPNFAAGRPRWALTRLEMLEMIPNRAGAINHDDEETEGPIRAGGCAAGGGGGGGGGSSCVAERMSGGGVGGGRTATGASAVRVDSC